MKNFFTTMMIFFCSLSLVGCDSMTKQDMGTVTGAVAGGLLGSTVGQGSGRVLAIAAGSLAGAFIGGAVGKSMDDTDKLKMNNALENNNVGQPAYWHNNHSDTNYEVVPTRNVTVSGNDYCREYRTTAYIGGKKRQVYGTACRQPDGSWQAVNNQ
ncbi:MAG: glycine zipper 2TM domain-containing protein [Gammaproteobacteria bacterium]|nr:glycine zipper 2TM domain-containing protein [Gammaproteobacteria bacterium]